MQQFPELPVDLEYLMQQFPEVPVDLGPPPSQRAEVSSQGPAGSRPPPMPFEEHALNWDFLLRSLQPYLLGEGVAFRYGFHPQVRKFYKEHSNFARDIFHEWQKLQKLYDETFALFRKTRDEKKNYVVDENLEENLRGQLERLYGRWLDALVTSNHRVIAYLRDLYPHSTWERQFRDLTMNERTVHDFISNQQVWNKLYFNNVQLTVRRDLVGNNQQEIEAKLPILKQGENIMYIAHTQEGLRFRIYYRSAADPWVRDYVRDPVFSEYKVIPWDALPANFPRAIDDIVSQQSDWLSAILTYTTQQGLTDPNIFLVGPQKLPHEHPSKEIITESLIRILEKQWQIVGTMHSTLQMLRTHQPLSTKAAKILYRLGEWISISMGLMSMIGALPVGVLALLFGISAFASPIAGILLFIGGICACALLSKGFLILNEYFARHLMPTLTVTDEVRQVNAVMQKSKPLTFFRSADLGQPEVQAVNDPLEDQSAQAHEPPNLESSIPLPSM